MRNKRWIFGVLLFLLVSGAVGAYFLNRSSVSMAEGGASGAIMIFGKPVIKLGRMQESKFTGSVDEAFKKSDNYVDGQLIRTPKYVHDGFFSSELENIVYATDMETNEVATYKWTEETSYLCQTPKMVEPPAELNLEVDLKRDLKNYAFVWQGDGWRGTMGADGMNLFRGDRHVGEGMKLYTMGPGDPTKEIQELVAVVLFTSRDECNNMVEGELINE